MRKIPLFLSIVCLFLTASCDRVFKDDSPVLLSFENLEEAEYLRVEEPGTSVFRDGAAWATFWEAHSTMAVPSVDFDREMLIAVLWGEGYSGCSNSVEAISRVSVIPVSSRIVVEIGELPFLGPCDALVYPLQVIRVERRDHTVTFAGEVPGQ